MVSACGALFRAAAVGAQTLKILVAVVPAVPGQDVVDLYIPLPEFPATADAGAPPGVPRITSKEISLLSSHSCSILSVFCFHVQEVHRTGLL